MGTEIERKFLVIDGSWRAGAPGTEIRQGYVHAGADRSVRIRTSGKRAYLTLKQARSGFTRQEYEYDIPLYDAQEMLASMCDGRLIEKTRFSLTVAGRKWVVDEFAGDNQGLIVAEIELDSEDEPFEQPAWAGSEVTAEPRYFNVNLIAHPYCRWTAAEKAGPDGGGSGAGEAGGSARPATCRRRNAIEAAMSMRPGAGARRRRPWEIPAR
ncbi:MAG: CYTH domain-containing protein [Rhodospirillales bacterium]